MELGDTNDFTLAYELHEKIDRATDKSFEREAYVKLLTLAHGSSKAKTLTAQFIPKFFKYYPEDAEKAIDALMDLCEDEELTIRTTTIKQIPIWVKENKEQAAKATDILTQLLQAEDITERNHVRQALMMVIRLDSQSALTMIFQGTMKTPEIRDKAIEFLTADFLPCKNEFFEKNSALEKQFAEEVIRTLEDVNGPAFTSLINILISLRMYGKEHVKNRNELIKTLVKTLPEDKFNPSNEEAVRKLIALSKTVLNFQESGGTSLTILLAFFVNHIFRNFNQVPERMRTTLLRQFADALRLGNPSSSDVEPALEPLKKLIMELVPVPSTGTSEDPKVDFSRVEAASIALYLIALKKPEVVEGEDLAIRLKFLYKISQESLSKLKSVQQQQKQAGIRDSTTEDKEKKTENAILAINNIFSCVKELLKPGRNRSKINLHPAWRPSVPIVQQSQTQQSSQSSQQTKRKASDTNNEISSSSALGVSAKKYKQPAPPSVKPQLPAKSVQLNAKITQTGPAKVERGFYMTPAVRTQSNGSNTGGTTSGSGVVRTGSSNPLGLGAAEKRSSNIRGRGGRKLRR